MSGHNPFDTTNVSDDEVFDFSEPYEEPKQLEPGRYPARLIDLENAVSKKGNPMYVWIIALESDPSGDPWCAGREFKLYTARTAAAMFKVNETLLALGLGKLENGHVVAKFKKSDALNRPCTAVIAMEQGKGEYANREFPRLQKLEPAKKSEGVNFNG